MISEIECKNVGFVYIHNVNVRSTKNQFINEDLSEKMMISEIECKNVGFVNIDAGVSTDLFFVWLLLSLLSCPLQARAEQSTGLRGLGAEEGRELS